MYMLTGDSNFSLIYWDSETVYGGAANMRTQAETLLNLAVEFCLNQYITTRIRGNNIFHIVMINDDQLTHGYSVEKTQLSSNKIV